MALFRLKVIVFLLFSKCHILKQGREIAQCITT